LPDVGRAEARSAEIQTPDGVALSFQVSVNKVEPSKTVLRRNLLAKDRCRVAVLDEVEPRRPEVPLVSSPASFACRAERLARTGTCPDGPVVGPPGAPQGVGPDADPCEEVALSKSPKVICSDIFDAPCVHLARCDVPRLDQLLEPRGGEGVDLVVVCGHSPFSGSLSQLSMALCGQHGAPVQGILFLVDLPPDVVARILRQLSPEAFDVLLDDALDAGLALCSGHVTTTS